MASYVPPHKRHSHGPEKLSPIPASFIPHFNRNLNLGSSRHNQEKAGKITYADGAISKWFALGLNDDNQLPSYVHLQPVSVEPIERKTGEKPLALLNHQADSEKFEEEKITSPWEDVAANVWPDILSAFQIVRNEMESQKLGEVRPTLVARFGKVLFHRDTSGTIGTVGDNSISEKTLRELRRIFYTSIPPSYLENIIDVVVPKIGLDFEEEKDIYHVKLSDNKCPDATISCKCIVSKENRRLQFYKIELNQVRQMVADISCLHKGLDLRLMLRTKRIITSLTDDEETSIRDLVDSAVLDPNVRGGLRWPLGKASAGERYNVVGVWHTVARAYSNSSMRLKVREADRYDFRTGTGEASAEVLVKLKGLVSELREKKLNTDSVSETLKDALKMIWEQFLHFSYFLN